MPHKPIDEMTKDEFLAKSPSGYRYLAEKPTYAEEHIAWVDSNQEIVLTDDFFDHSPSDRKWILEHEKAHSSISPHEDRFWKVAESGAIGHFDEDEMKWKGIVGGRNPEETLTQLITNAREGEAVPQEVLDAYADKIHPSGELHIGDVPIKSYSSPSYLARLIIEAVDSGMDLDEAISIIKEESQSVGVPDETIKDAINMVKRELEEYEEKQKD